MSDPDHIQGNLGELDTFGKHRGRSLKELVEQEADYLQWMLDKDFPEDTKSVIAQAMEGRYSVPE